MLWPLNRKRQFLVLAALWLFFCLRGGFYAASLPLWEGFDEWAHYAVIQRMATAHEALVSRDERVSREIQTSLTLAPRRPGGRPGELEYGEYWKLSQAQRVARENALRSIPARYAVEVAPDGYGIYEAQQAPLYYWLLTPVYLLLSKAPFPARVWLLRVVSLLFASAVIPLTFFTAREACGRAHRALSLTAVVAAMPQLMMLVNHVGNECLAIPMGSLCLFALLRWKRQPNSMRRSLILGTALGFALLAKAYFLALVPAIVILAAIYAWRQRVWVSAAVVLACAAGLSGWWYIRTWDLTRSFSGEQVEVAGAEAARGLLASLRTFRWGQALDFAFLSHTWIGNWSLLVVRSWIYHVSAGIAGLAAIGFAARLCRKNRSLPSASDLSLLGAIFLLFSMAVMYQSLRNFQATGIALSMGYYILAIVAAEVIILTVGLEELVPERVAPAIAPALALFLFGVEFFGLNFYSIPYYTASTKRLPSGGLPALPLSALRHGGFSQIFQKLASETPGGLSAGVLQGLWGAFLVASGGVFIIALLTAIWRAGEAEMIRPQNNP